MGTLQTDTRVVLAYADKLRTMTPAQLMDELEVLHTTEPLRFTRRAKPHARRTREPVQRMTRLRAAVVAIGVATAALTGCSHTPPVQPAPAAATHGGNFMPAYLDMLRGKTPGPDNACHPTTPQQLLAPCDTH